MAKVILTSDELAIFLQNSNLKPDIKTLSIGEYMVELSVDSLITKEKTVETKKIKQAIDINKAVSSSYVENAYHPSLKKTNSYITAMLMLQNCEKGTLIHSNDFVGIGNANPSDVCRFLLNNSVVEKIHKGKYVYCISTYTKWLEVFLDYVIQKNKKADIKDISDKYGLDYVKLSNTINTIIRRTNIEVPFAKKGNLIYKV